MADVEVVKPDAADAGAGADAGQADAGGKTDAGKGQVARSGASATVAGSAKGADAGAAEGGAEAAAEGSDAKPDAWEEWKARIAGDDPKVRKELDRYADPDALWKKVKNLEKKMTDAGKRTRPAADAKPEEIAEYRKAAGIPDTVEAYTEAVTMPDGVVVGEFDKPLVDSFIAYAHEKSVDPVAVEAGLGWYYSQQEKAAADLEAIDTRNRDDCQKALDRKWGNSMEGNINAIGALFADMPGGLSPEGNSLYARLLGGRLADGRMIGDDPDVLSALVTWAKELNPAATLPGGVGVNASMARLAEIRAMRRDDFAKYDASPAIKAEELELIEVEERMKSRASNRAA